MLVAANLLWGANYAMSKFAYGAWNPLAFSVTRFLIAGVICTALVRRHEGPPRIARAHIPMLLGCAAVGITANQLFFTTATDHTTAGNVVLIMTASPALAAFFAMVAGHEHVPGTALAVARGVTHRRGAGGDRRCRSQRRKLCG